MMFLGFDDLEDATALIEALHEQIAGLKEELESEREDAKRLRRLFSRLYDERDKLKEELGEMKAANTALQCAVDNALSAIQNIGSFVDDKYRAVEQLTQ